MADATSSQLPSDDAVERFRMALEERTDRGFLYGSDLLTFGEAEDALLMICSPSCPHGVSGTRCDVCYGDGLLVRAALTAIPSDDGLIKALEEIRDYVPSMNGTQAHTQIAVMAKKTAREALSRHKAPLSALQVTEGDKR